MTERDPDYEQWQAALATFQELSAQYQALLKAVQVGFGFLSDESAATARRMTRIEAKIDAIDTTLQQLLPHMAVIAAHVSAQQRQHTPPPQARPRQSRRANGE